MRQEIPESVKQYISTGGVPALYVGTYGKYNGGSIFGAWIDLTNFDDYDDFLEVCRELHSDEADPEFMFQDFECFPRKFYCESGMREDFDELVEWMELDEEQRNIVEEYWDENDSSSSIRDILDRYVCRADDMDAYANEMFETDCINYNVPDFIRDMVTDKSKREHYLCDGVETSNFFYCE